MKPTMPSAASNIVLTAGSGTFAVAVLVRTDILPSSWKAPIRLPKRSTTFVTIVETPAPIAPANRPDPPRTWYDTVPPPDQLNGSPPGGNAPKRLLLPWGSVKDQPRPELPKPMPRSVLPS